nr:hypothetical protein CFP56_21745 [Quercus suber]
MLVRILVQPNTSARGRVFQTLLRTLGHPKGGVKRHALEQAVGGEHGKCQIYVPVNDPQAIYALSRRRSLIHKPKRPHAGYIAIHVHGYRSMLFRQITYWLPVLGIWCCPLHHLTLDPLKFYSTVITIAISRGGRLVDRINVHDTILKRKGLTLQTYFCSDHGSPSTYPTISSSGGPGTRLDDARRC